MTSAGAILAAKAALFLLGVAGVLGATDHPVAAAIVGAAGTVLNISALIWVLRQESRR